MNISLLLGLIVGIIIPGNYPYSNNRENKIYVYGKYFGQDTSKKSQVLYTGRIWKNKYHLIDGDQFLFTSFFLSGTVSINGKTFNNLRIKYDIFSDEIITPVNSEDILQLNKEMLDSFTISFEDKIYRFTNFRKDSVKGYTGYLNSLYNGISSFYVKYKKSISPSFTPQSDGHFIQTHLMYIRKKDILYPVEGLKSLLKVLDEKNDEIRSFIKKNKLKISKKVPESFLPVIKYYDSLNQ